MKLSRTSQSSQIELETANKITTNRQNHSYKIMLLLLLKKTRNRKCKMLMLYKKTFPIPFHSRMDTNVLILSVVCLWCLLIKFAMIFNAWLFFCAGKYYLDLICLKRNYWKKLFVSSSTDLLQKIDSFFLSTNFMVNSIYFP